MRTVFSCASFGPVVVAIAAVLSLSTQSGCLFDKNGDGGPANGQGGGLVLHPMAPDPSVAYQHLYKLQVIYITEKLKDGKQKAEFWRFLDETAVPLEKRRLLERNGLRIAAGGDLALERLRTVLPQLEDVTVRVLQPIYARQGYTLTVPLGTPDADMTLFYALANGTVAGQDFARASSFIRLTTRADPAPDTTSITISEHIVYGKSEPAYRRTATGLILSDRRPTFDFDDLKTEVKIRGGQVVAIGLAPGHEMSLGQRLMIVGNPTGQYATTVLLMPELVAPAKLPPGVTPAGAPEQQPVPGPGLPTPEPETETLSAP